MIFGSAPLYCFNAKRNTYRVDVLSPPAQTSRLFRIRFLFCEWHLSKQKVVCFVVFAAFAAEGERGRGGDVIRMFLLLFHFLFLPPAALCMSQKGFFFTQRMSDAVPPPPPENQPSLGSSSAFLSLFLPLPPLPGRAMDPSQPSH